MNDTIKNLFRTDIHEETIKLIDRFDLSITAVRQKQNHADLELKNAISSGKDRKEILETMRGSFHTLMSDRVIETIHQKFNSDREVVSSESFDLLANESAGTQKLFALASFLVNTLKYGEILIIDEFDARLHPLMSRSIVELFNSNETNPNNAQLIVMTYDTNLLSNKIFRRDQIWFTEKDRYGATALYSLAEYKVRNDASFESDYIKGKYGAIPYIQVAESFIEAHA